MASENEWECSKEVCKDEWNSHADACVDGSKSREVCIEL